MRNFSVVALLLTAPAFTRANDMDTVTVWLDDGRVLTAEVDDRSDEHRLWLRFSRPLVTLVSAAPWHTVVQGSYQEKTYRADEFRALALRLKGSAPSATLPETLPVPQEAAKSSQMVPERPPTAAYSTHAATPRVRSLRIDAELANWDSDVEMDGLLLHVYALGEHGEPVPVDGTLRLEVIGQRFARRRQLNPFFQLARTSHRVLKHHFGPSCSATYRIPFRTLHPEFQLDVAAHGLVHARLGVPGQGVFEVSETVRLRTFNPVRDQLQMEQGTRFFASERTRGAGP